MEEINWVVDMAAKVQSYDPVQESMARENRSVYRMPCSMIDVSKKSAYTPQMISFGPYHHGQPHLIPMEEHKQRALFHFLKRTFIPLQKVVESLKQVEQQLLSHYDEPPALQDPSAFLKMMVVDGCFMLEILRMAEKMPKDYTPNEPIFSRHGMLYVLPYIQRDMLMLENQIPLLVLDRLVAVERNKPTSDDGYINKLVADFFSLHSLNQTTAAGGLGLHVLDVVRKGLIQGPFQLSRSAGRKKLSLAIRSVVGLYEAGIRFRKSKTNSLRDIDFKQGVLKLPAILVDDTTESMLLNLMAFERLHVGAGNEVSSYVSFMDTLIESAKDVAMLQTRGIILNALGSDKAVSKIFNKLARDVTIDPSSKLGEVHRKLSRYSTQKRNAWRANLMHTYFRNPWAFLSLVAAIVFLGFTIAQTVYSALSYYVSLNGNASSTFP